MKLRLGYFNGREDYCFNGFAFKDLIYKNSYATHLFCYPEFLGELIDCLDFRNIGKYYMDHSTCYCYEYKIPLKYVIFDGYDLYSYGQRQKHLIMCVF